MRGRVIGALILAGVLAAGAVWVVTGGSSGSSSATTALPASDPQPSDAPPTDATPSASSSGDHQDPSSWDPSQMPNPCRTLTSTEVTAVVGRPAATGRRLDSWPPLCSFQLGGGAQTFVYVEDNALSTGRIEFDQLSHGTEVPQQVAGLGKSAYWLTSTTELHAMVGPAHVAIKFAGQGVPADAQVKAEALARIVIPRIGSTS